MAKNRIDSILSRFTEIRKGEASIALLFFSYFFLVTAPYSIIKSLRNTKILDEMGENWLPVAYLLTALVIGFIVAVHSRIQNRLTRPVLLISSLLFFMLTGLAFMVLFNREIAWVSLIYWIWANVFIVVLATQFWMAVNDVFNPREAKRLIGFIGSGGILGGVVGGLMTSHLARTPLYEYLLVFVAAMLALAALVVTRIFRARTSIPADDSETNSESPLHPIRVGFKDCYMTVKNNSYLKVLAAIVSVTIVVSTLIDFQFNSVISSKVIGGSNLAVFFGRFNAGMMFFAFLLQLLMTSGIIKKYGLRSALLLYPLILFICSAAIAFFPFVLVAVIIKGSDKSLSYSINQSSRELLYIPVSPEEKYKAKIFIDMFINRFAKGLGAVILIILLSLKLGLAYVSVVSAALILTWILLNIRVIKEYVMTIKNKLKLKWERGEHLIDREIDLDYTKLVFDMIESRRRSPVLFAMSLYDLLRKGRMTPELKELIKQSGDDAQISSISSFIETGETSFLPESMESGTETELNSEVQDIMSLDVYQEVFGDFVSEALKKESKSGDEVTRMEIAKAIGFMSPEAVVTFRLSELIEDESPEVSRFAMESAAKLLKKEYVASLIKNLGRPLSREDAIVSLVRYGNRIVGILSDYIGDKEVPSEMRKGAAEVLSRIGTQEAADFLLYSLAREEECGLRTEIVDALDRIRMKSPEIVFEKGRIKQEIYRDVIQYCRRFTSLEEEDSGSQGDEFPSPFVIRILKMLILIYPRLDMTKALQNIQTGKQESIAYAVEMLDNTLEKEFKDYVIPLIEERSSLDRKKRFKSILKNLKI